MSRRRLTNHQWDVLKEMIPGKAGDPGRTGNDNRLFLDAVLWMARTGAPWRDLPELFGHWNTVWKRFSRWAKKGTWEVVFGVLAQDDPDLEYVSIDGTIVRAHQHSAGGKGGAEKQAIGRSRGGLTTKLHVAVDAHGNPLRIILTPGQEHDSKQAEALVFDISAEAVLADKAYDTNAFRDTLENREIAAVIPSKANRVTPIPHDRDLYKERHLVECFFCKIKDFRRISTRYEKTARNFLAMAHFIASIIWLR